MYIKSYEYKGYLFEISYNSKYGLYTAKCGHMYTYDTNLKDLEDKIETVVYHNDNYKL